MEIVRNATRHCNSRARNIFYTARILFRIGVSTYRYNVRHPIWSFEIFRRFFSIWRRFFISSRNAKLLIDIISSNVCLSRLSLFVFIIFRLNECLDTKKCPLKMHFIKREEGERREILFQETVTHRFNYYHALHIYQLTFRITYSFSSFRRLQNLLEKDIFQPVEWLSWLEKFEPILMCFRFYLP